MLRDLIEQKLVDVRAKLEHLRTLRRGLESAHASCANALARCDSRDECSPVLEAIAQAKREVKA
jgi:hypothetical protein